MIPQFTIIRYSISKFLRVALPLNNTFYYQCVDLICVHCTCTCISWISKMSCHRQQSLIILQFTRVPITILTFLSLKPFNRIRQPLFDLTRVSLLVRTWMRILKKSLAIFFFVSSYKLYFFELSSLVSYPFWVIDNFYLEASVS